MLNMFMFIPTILKQNYEELKVNSTLFALNLYNNEKLNQIYRDTWPNLGWAKKPQTPSKNDQKTVKTDPKTDYEGDAS